MLLLLLHLVVLIVVVARLAVVMVGFGDGLVDGGDYRNVGGAAGGASKTTTTPTITNNSETTEAHQRARITLITKPCFKRSTIGTTTM